MSEGRPRLPSLTAALAGIPAGIQAAGLWAGRRQLFVKLAQEAETATMFTATALRGELQRMAKRSTFHSIAVAGQDPLAELEYLVAALAPGLSLPAMLDHDGQRPDELKQLVGATELSMVQLTLDGSESESSLERAMACVALVAEKHLTHSLVLIPADSESDARLLRIVERTHGASADVAVVVHPSAESASDGNRRWALWMERATSVHGDVRIQLRLPAPTGTR